jgi:hypothetical protein
MFKMTLLVPGVVISTLLLLFISKDFLSSTFEELFNSTFDDMMEDLEVGGGEVDAENDEVIGVDVDDLSLISTDAVD